MPTSLPHTQTLTTQPTTLSCIKIPHISYHGLIRGYQLLTRTITSDYRARSRSRSAQDQPTDPAIASSSRSAPIAAEAPPEYVEVADEATADQLVRSGKAERVSDYADEKKHQSKASEAGYPGDDDGDSMTDDESDIIEVDDEAAWELDDMAERVAPPSYAESEADLATPAAAENESEESKVKKEEQMIRDLLSMAGPPPQPTQRIPCPVIIPQRRPRNKDRGFVKAYAPVLDNCGVSQEVFLKFLKDWLAASKVSSASSRAM